ncbi:MAG: transglycosylase SLT domain-containing protein [Gammaproteobacteria bacterium]|nr:transglycosylase SLT domain-containing protein [Gammaproteobacteria bacterium]
MALKAEDHPDIWARLRSGLSLPGRDHPRVLREIERYASEQDYLNKVTARARPFLHYVLQEVEKRGLPSEIALLPVVESAYSPQAESPKRAAGIWQIIPATARHLGLKQTFWYDERRDLMASTQAALSYLERLNAGFGGDWLLTLAAYNGGEGMVQRAITRNREAGLATDFWSLDLPRETETYVPRLLAITAVIAAPEVFGVNLSSIPNRRYLTQVKLTSQINLDTAAKLAGMSRAELTRLNSGYVRDATDPHGPHRLLLPVSKVTVFKDRLAAQQASAGLETAASPPAQTAQISQNSTAAPPPKPKGQRVYYTMRAGDSLTDIAARFRVGVNELRAWNAALLASLKNKSPQAGTTLTLYLQSTLVAQNP